MLLLCFLHSPPDAITVMGWKVEMCHLYSRNTGRQYYLIQKRSFRLVILFLDLNNARGRAEYARRGGETRRR